MYVCMYIYACRSIVSPRRAPSRVSPTDTSDKDTTTSLDKQPPHIAVAKVTHVFVYICTYAHVCVSVCVCVGAMLQCVWVSDTGHEVASCYLCLLL